MNNGKSVRNPTWREIRDLKQYFANKYEDSKHMDRFLRYSCFAVFPFYWRKYPASARKLMVVVYLGEPDDAETYAWIDGKLQRAKTPKTLRPLLSIRKSAPLRKATPVGRAETARRSSVIRSRKDKSFL